MPRDISEPVCLLNSRLTESAKAEAHVDAACDLLNQSSISLAIESAFDFLNLEDCDDSDTETEQDAR